MQTNQTSFQSLLKNHGGSTWFLVGSSSLPKSLTCGCCKSSCDYCAWHGWIGCWDKSKASWPQSPLEGGSGWTLVSSKHSELRFFWWRWMRRQHAISRIWYSQNWAASILITVCVVCVFIVFLSTCYHSSSIKWPARTADVRRGSGQVQYLHVVCADSAPQHIFWADFGYTTDTWHGGSGNR